MNYTTGGFELSAKITNEKENVTIDFIIGEANDIWSYVRKQNIDFGDLDATEKVLGDVRKMHPEFSKSYPIVLRYMCQMQEYDSRALRSYLTKIQSRPYTNEDEYLESQVDYVVILYKTRNKHWNATNVANLRKNIRNILKQEHQTLKKYAHDFDKQVTEQTEQLSRLAMDELYEFAQCVGTDGMRAAGTVRVETDISSCEAPTIDIQPSELKNAELLLA